MRERERERREGGIVGNSFLHFKHTEAHTYGAGGRQTRSLSKAAVVHTLCSFPPPGTVRARQAALFGDSPRGKFFFFFGAYCLEPINCGICFFFVRRVIYFFFACEDF